MARPYRKRNNKRKPNYMARGNSYISTASKALALAYSVKKLVNVEYKKFDTNISAAISTAGVTYNLVNMAQGDTDNLRNGNSIKLTSLQYKLLLRQNTSAISTSLRIVIVKDNQQVADTAPGFNAVFESTDPTISFLNNETVGRFSIVHDRTHLLSNGDNFIRMEKWFKTLNSHVRYNGSAATDLQKGCYYLMLISDESTNTPSVKINVRATYVDN